MAVFLLFATSFIVFQQMREKQFKIDMLDMRLQDYNSRMGEWMATAGDLTEERYDDYVRRHHIQSIRVTVITTDGKVVYDSKLKDYSHVKSHLDRKEVREALTAGHGSTVDRNSTTVGGQFFYSATLFKRQGVVIRSALPYDNNLAESLRADQHFIWFALTAVVMLTIILQRFTHRLGDNINKLRIFAGRADKNESLDTEDLAVFPNDELGEIAERIIKIYKRLQTTRREQDILKRELTQNIAHELKTPVASIHGYLETILENPHISHDNRQLFLQRCFAQSQRLAALLHDISTLNRIDDAPDIIEFDVTDIRRTVDDIAKDTSLQMEAKGMTFVNNIPKDVMVRGNASLLYSVFRNLTDNAIAYAGTGTTVTVDAVDNGGEWSFTFSDNGVGVPPEHLPRLFERFYRIDKGRSRKMGGTGLGLAIVKNSIALHGGKVTVRNNIEGGLRFEFSLRKA